jgi:hypothetical protein
MADYLSRIANLTCIETIERFRSDQEGQLRKYDTIRLEVTLVNNRELFSKLGAAKIEVSDVSEFNGGGAIESGLFAAYAHGVFQENWATYHYAGEEMLRNRRTARYNYEVPLPGSGYRISIGGRQAVLPYSGSFWVDGKTLEVMRLTVHPNGLPRWSGIWNVQQTIDYARVRLSGADYRLPHRAEMTVLGMSWGQTQNVTEFTHWLRYVVESALVIEGESPATSKAEQALELPLGLELSTRFDTEISLEEAVEGDPIAAVLERDAVLKGRRIVPAGAKLTGRIRGIEHLPSGDYRLSLEFAQLESSARRVRFLARLTGVNSPSGVMRSKTDSSLLSVADLRTRGSRLHLGRDLILVWRTGWI